MSAREIGIWRKSLRHQIIQSFHNLNSKQIYYAIKNPDLPALFSPDLEPFCKEIEMPVSLLPDVFSPYEIFNSRIKENNFIRFIEDEVTCESIEIQLPTNLKDEQIAIINKFANALRNRKLQSNLNGDSITSERSSIARQWTFVVRLNTSTDHNNHVRIAALCRLAQEMNLTFPPEAFIDAIFTFFGKKLDELNYDQFTQLMTTF